MREAAGPNPALSTKYNTNFKTDYDYETILCNDTVDAARGGCAADGMGGDDDRAVLLERQRFLRHDIHGDGRNRLFRALLIGT